MWWLRLLWAWIMAGEPERQDVPRAVPSVPTVPAVTIEQVEARLAELAEMHRTNPDQLGAEVTMIRVDQWLDELLRLRPGRPA